jgi:tape measure domain-containing protein
MPTIDERVVAVAFENAVFEQRVSVTMTTLTKLDTAIKNVGGTSGFDKIEAQANKVTLQGPMSALDKLKAKLGGAGQGAAEGLGEIDKAGNKVSLEHPIEALDKVQSKLGQVGAGTTFTDIERAADRVELSGLTRALDNVTNKFSVLQGAASVALGGIASQAAMKGAAFAKSFAIGPVVDGFHEYATNLNSIQTILANTQDSGGNLKTVNAALQELNTYSDKTIYNFSEMAKNIGTFTAAGVQLKPATSAIKGIANLAALSGSNSQQASTAMYQLSQAIAAGRVGLQDWNSVVNAGMGGAVFQKALMRTAENMGTVAKGAVKIDKATGKATINGNSFRESIQAKPGQKSWLTSDVLTKTLSQFTGDLTDAQLAAQGFNAAQIKAIQAQAKTAQAAATEVKTLPQVFDVARETIGSGWGQTFQTIFGNFEQSKKTFTELSNTINGFINTNSQARNKVLKDWSELGGRTQLIDGIKQAFQNLMDIIKPIHDAFRDIFPAETGQSLFALTKGFATLMANLKPSQTTIDNLRRTFDGLFAVVHIGFSIIKGLIGVIFDLLGVVGKGAGGFLAFTGGVGDFLKAIDTALTKGGALEGFFKGLGAIISLPLHLLGALAGAIANLFGGGHEEAAKGFTNSLDEANKRLGPMKAIVDKVVQGWEALVKVFDRIKTALDPFISSMADKLSGVGDLLANMFKGLDYDKIMQGLQVGFIGGIFLTLKKAFSGGATGGIVSSLKGTLGQINGVLEATTSHLEAMEKKVQAETLLAIAAAVAALAAGIYVLSTIDGKKLSKAMTAVAVGLGELMGAMKLMMSGTGKLAVLQLPLIAAGMIGLAIAVTILAGALKIFATMNWKDIGKGLVGVAGSLTAVALGMQLMPATLPLTAAGLLLISVALNAIAVAMKTFGSMKLEEIAKGIFAMVEALGGIALGVSLMPPTLPLTAAGLILMGVALAAIGGALRAMGSMDFGTIVKGLAAMMVAIAGIGLAISLVPPTIALTAAGLLVLGQAMVVTAGAIALLGNLGVGQLVKGIVGLAGALIVLAGGLTLMIVSLPGAAALMVAAGALAVLVPVLGLLGAMKWSTIFKGLGAMAAILVTIGVAGLVAAPALTAIGIALIPLGLGFLLVASAAKMFAGAIALLSNEGQKGFAVFMVALTGFVALIPNLILSFVKGILGIADQITVLAPKIVMALGVIIDTIIAFVIENAPKLAIAIGVLVDSILQVLLTNTPKLIAAGVKLLNDLLGGISQNIGSITTKVAEIIIKFEGALAAKAPDLVNAGAKTLVAFLQGITNNIPKVVAAVTNMVTQFVKALGTNVARVIGAGQDLILKLIAAIVGLIPKVISTGIDIIVNFLNGIEQAIPRIKNKALSVARTFLNNLADGLVGMADIAFKALIRFLNGFADAIRNNQQQLFDAGANVGSAILDGVIDGFGRMGGLVRKALEKVFQLLPGWAKKVLGISSPSTVFAEIGKFTMLGFAKGVEDNHKSVLDAGAGVANALPNMFRSVLGIHSPSEVMRDIGKQVNDGFAQGLRGSQDDIRAAFKDLNDKLKDSINTQKQTIADEQGKLDDLLNAKKPDLKAIAAAQDALAKDKDLLAQERSAREELISGLDAQKKKLLGLKSDYDTITKQLDDAKQALDQAEQARAQAKQGIVDKYDTTPTVDDDSKTKVADYVKALQDQITATKSYTDTLAKLRAIGLDDTTYQKLLDEGLAGKDFAEQLLAGGKTAVDSVNALDTQLLGAAKKLADDMSAQLYDAGVNAAQALVTALQSQQSALEKQMEALAKAMVNAMRRQLKIKSPSRVMLEIGKFAAQGVVDGLRGSSQAVQDAAAGIGDDAASAMSDGLSHISSVLSAEVDPDLTITPVLDLTQFQKDAQKMGDLSNVVPITAAASFGLAGSISVEKSTADAAAAAASSAGPSFNFEQNNYSPESLSEIEIYRQTRNQFSQLKSMVGVP